jgi:hypothetical protein
MIEQKPIGGFFELEVQRSQHSFHPGALALTNGRACLNLILQQLQPQKVWVPFYTCDALLHPLRLNQIPYGFYAVNSALELAQSPTLDEEEYLIYINYFGLKTCYVEQLSARYGDRLILDNTQAFFERGNGKHWAFNSARKFFGVPDGGYLYAPDTAHLSSAYPPAEIRYQHLVNRLLGKQQQSYAEYGAAETALNADIQAMSILSQTLLSAVDYATVIQKRRENFQIYHAAFHAQNQISGTIAEQIDAGVPFHYPLFLQRPIERRSLFQNQIFVPTLWQETLNRGIPGFQLERELTQQLLPLPLDHRYGTAEINTVIHILQTLLQS